MNYSIKTKGKFLFLALSTFSLTVLMVITTLLWWYFISPQLHEINTILAKSILTLLRIFYIVVILGIIMLFYECYSNRSLRLFHKIIRFSIVFLFPVNVFVGKFFRIKKDTVRESFVQVNNSFIKTNRKKFNPQDILVLLPHCLQDYDCPYRVTNNIDTCVECNKCTISDFKRMKKEYGTKIAIATGGTLARKIIVQARPKCIIAVACQRDLVDGLLEVFPIPVYGILNEAPFGPCINTTVDVQKIKDFLNHFILSKEG
jgi:hypothetical protein